MPENPGTLAALARHHLIGLDRTKEHTTIATATLELILQGVIDLAEPTHETMLRQRMDQHMAGVIARANTANAPDFDG